MTTQAEQLASIEEQNRRIEEMLGRVLGVLFQDEQVQEERAFIESLEGLTTEEMVAANDQAQAAPLAASSLERLVGKED